jgi:hypothetical protein
MPLRLFLGFQPYVTHAKKKNNSGKLKFISKKTVLVLLSVVFHECSFSPVVIFGHTDSFSPAASFFARTDRQKLRRRWRFSLLTRPKPRTPNPNSDTRSATLLRDPPPPSPRSVVSGLSSIAMAHNNPSHLMPSGTRLSTFSTAFLDALWATFGCVWRFWGLCVVSSVWRSWNRGFDVRRGNGGVGLGQSWLTGASGRRYGWSWRGTRSSWARCVGSMCTSTWCWKMSLNSKLWFRSCHMRNRLVVMDGVGDEWSGVGSGVSSVWLCAAKLRQKGDASRSLSRYYWMETILQS